MEEVVVEHKAEVEAAYLLPNMEVNTVVSTATLPP